MAEQRTKADAGVGTTRVDLRNIEKMEHEARCEGFTVVVDEPPERGGTKKGMHPLGYFLVGAASCFLTQFAKEAARSNLKIDKMEISCRGHYDRVKTREFTDVIYDVKIGGQETEENAIELLYQAEKRCFVHQTLKKALPLTSNLSLNGKRIASHTIGPQSSRKL